MENSVGFALAEYQWQQRQQGNGPKQTQIVAPNLGVDGQSEMGAQQHSSQFDQLLKKCESIAGQMVQLQNAQNALLGRIVLLEAQQQQMANGLAQKTTNGPKLGSATQQQEKVAEVAAPAVDSAPTKQSNCWDPTGRFCDVSNYSKYDLQIKSLTIQYSHLRSANGNDWRSVFAKNSIQSCANSNGYFYFEIAMEKLQSQFGAIIGVAVKQKPFLSVVGRCGTFALQSNGTFWANGRQQMTNGLSLEINGLSFGRGDVLGFGVYLANGQIVFAKNGHPLKLMPDLFIHSVPTDRLFPFVSLLCPGDQIEANFGPNFLFTNA